MLLGPRRIVGPVADGPGFLVRCFCGTVVRSDAAAPEPSGTRQTAGSGLHARRCPAAEARPREREAAREVVHARPALAAAWLDARARERERRAVPAE